MLSERNKFMAMKRRDFLKRFGSLVGGAVVLSCGSGGGGGSAPPIPNGYTFFRVAGSGGAMPDGTAADDFPGAVKINDNHDILFQADSAGVGGVYEYAMDFSGETPGIASARKIVREGDTLGDGVVVGGLKLGSPNKLGYYAAIITTADGIQSVYMEKEKNGLEPVAKALDKLPGGKGAFGASFGDIELDDTNSIMLVSHYSPINGSQPKEGLFYLCGGMVTDAGRMLASSGDLLPESSTTVGRIGLVDINKTSGEYVAQINCGIAVTQMSKALPPRHMPITALMGGSIHSTRPGKRLIGASLPLGISKAAAKSALRGDILYGPRIGGPGDKVAQVIHTGDNSLSLYFDDREVAHTGGLSPSDKIIKSFSGPAVIDSGLLYYLVYTEEGEELCVYNGVVSKTILKSGDKLSDQDANAVMSMSFGVVRNMVDKDGRVVFMGVFEDQSKAIVVGIPV
jgi:hypothetical protein